MSSLSMLLTCTPVACTSAEIAPKYMAYKFTKSTTGGQQIIFNGWEKGVANSPLEGLGQVVNMNVYSKPGRAIIQQKATQVLSGMSGIGKWFVRNPLNQDIYSLDSSGVVRISTDNGDTWSTVSGNTTTSASGNGLGIWLSPNDKTKAFLFVARNALLDVYNISTTTWTNGWQSLESTSGDHMMYTGLDNILYIGNRSYVATFEEVLGSTFVPGTSSTYKWNNKALDIPSQYDIQTLSPLGTNLMIGASTGFVGSTGLSSDSQIFPWDRVSDTFTLPIQINDLGVNQLFTRNNILYINSGLKGDIRYTNGSDTQMFRELYNLNLENTLRPYAGAMNALGEEILFGVGVRGLSTDTGPLGVYSTKDETYVLRNTVSTGETTKVQIGAILAISDSEYVFSWAKDTGSTTRGIDKVGKDSLLYSNYLAYIETDLVYVGDFIRSQNFSRIQFQLAKPLVGGQGIKIEYRKNLSDSFTTIGTWDFATIGSRLSYESDASINNAEWIQLKISLNPSTNGLLSPELIHVILKE